jgi:amino acid transporter
MIEDHKENHSQNNVCNGSTERKINFIPWLLVAIMGVLLMSNYFGGTETIGSSLNRFNWLPLLLTLACPLMMVFMMFGHGHGSHQDNGSNQNANSGHGGCCGGQANKEPGK